ncbi:MAG: hypothetical protein H6670_04440 [Anaerolineaceae bacterium]|nr:hypothetical protein [Anaerolineaceae bacterium]
MGYEYEIALSLILTSETPQSVTDVVRYGISLFESQSAKNQLPELPEHAFFRKTDWEKVFCSVHSLLMPGDCFLRLSKETDELYSMTMRIVPCADWETSLSFIHWISQFSWCDGYIGMFRDNHNAPRVTLFYREESTTYLVEVTPPVLGVSREEVEVVKCIVTDDGDLKVV